MLLKIALLCAIFSFSVLISLYGNSCLLLAVSIGKYKRSNTSTSSEGQLLKGRKRKRRATEELEDDVFGDTTDDSKEIPAAIKCFLHVSKFLNV